MAPNRYNVSLPKTTVAVNSPAEMFFFTILSILKSHA